MPTVTPPPERYDFPYPGQVVERILPLEETRKLCEQIGVGRYDACAGFITLNDGSRACFVVVPENGPDENTDHYIRHEIGHCNGWPAWHPAD
jgi:hypothetical protein